MLKNALFLKKAVKIATALGNPPLNPRWLPAAAGFRLQTPKLLLPLNLRVTFEHCSDFLASLKLRRVVSYLSDG